MSDELVLIDRGEGFATITLNRPKSLNAMSCALRIQLMDAFRALGADDQIGAVVITGSGRAFSAGLDLKEVSGEIVPERKVSDREFLGALGELKKPMIAAVNGVAVTGGLELILQCDFIIASTEARFADTHARVGIVSGWGMTQMLPRLIGINRAREMCLTGNFIDAQTAYEWGLVNHVVAPEELLPTCHKLASDIVSTEPNARGKTRHLINEGWQTTLADGLKVEREMSDEHQRRRGEYAHELQARRVDVQQRGRQQSGA